MQPLGDASLGGLARNHRALVESLPAAAWFWEIGAMMQIDSVRPL